MNEKLKQHYEDVITAIINDDSTAAQKSFHEVLRAKTRSILGEESEENDEMPENEDENEDEDKDKDENEDKDEDKDEDEDEE